MNKWMLYKGCVKAGGYLVRGLEGRHIFNIPATLVDLRAEPATQKDNLHAEVMCRIELTS